MSTHPRGWLGYTCPLKVTCFVSILSRPKPAMVGQYVCPRSSQVTPVSPGLLCTLCSLAVPSLSSKSTCLWLLCVCAAHVVHPSTLGGRYLLGGHCEIRDVCLNASLGAASVFLCPQNATSLSVWCLRFCVFSSHVHFLSSSVCPCSLPPHLLYLLGVCRAQPAPGTGSFLTP